MDHMDDGFGPGFSSHGPSSSSSDPGALPFSGAMPVGSTRPMGIPSRLRPGRYDTEIETTPLTPPSSSHSLALVFDSSKIYESHPHKYSLLLKRDPAGQTLPETTNVQTGVQDQPKPSSAPAASLTVKDGRVVAMGGSSSSNTSSISTTAVSSSGTADPKRSEALLPANPSTALPPSGPVTAAPVNHGGSARDQLSGKMGKSHFIPRDFLHSFTAIKAIKPSSFSKIPEDQDAPGQSTVSEPSPQPQPASEATRQASSQGALGAGKSLQEISSVEKVPGGGSQPVQPPARRLFGFGPLYHPLPDTVCGTAPLEPSADAMRRRSSSPNLSALSEAVQQGGLTGMGYSGGSRRGSVDATDSGSATRTSAKPKEKRVSPSEVNTWLTGTF